MALVLDTGPIVAAVNRGDPNHRRCAAVLAGGEDFVVPSPILVEVDYWLGKLVGPQAWADFVDDVVTGAYRVIHPSEAFHPLHYAVTDESGRFEFADVPPGTYQIVAWHEGWGLAGKEQAYDVLTEHSVQRPYSSPNPRRGRSR